ncbi:ead/Ea22-like family protein [Escherichia albertii]|nr:ead/Ea22-like family protein [Escherichia albertii]MCZ9254069.1 ead/Ea22-like family protein [Escherichia albertii]
MSKIDYQALREAAQNYQSTLAWYEAIPDSPNAERDCDAALAAFKREIRHREVDIIADLLDELEEAKSKLNEQREYYEGVISDGSKHIAELEKQCAEWERKALSNFEECAAMAERIEEMQTKSAPDSFGIIGENIRTQDNRITSDPMFCVYQKREIVVDADYDYDRIVWVDEDGNEANKRQSRRLELLHENFREPPEKWRRVAVKDIDEFVTCCFTEQGCKDYLAANGHNLRLPFIYVKSGFRNAEYIGIRNWLAGIRIKGE